MKKTYIYLLAMILLLTGCSSSNINNEIVTQTYHISSIERENESAIKQTKIVLNQKESLNKGFEIKSVASDGKNLEDKIDKINRYVIEMSEGW